MQLNAERELTKEENYKNVNLYLLVLAYNHIYIPKIKVL